MSKLLISKDELRNAIIEAVRVGGETKVFVNSKGSIFTSNASEESLEAGGMNITESISVKSYGDLNYDNAEDFVEEDADFCYLDNFESDNIIFEEDCEFGTVEFEGKKYILAQNACVDNANGTDGEVIYKALAEDTEGNEYMVVWETTKDFDDSHELHGLEDLIKKFTNVKINQPYLNH